MKELEDKLAKLLLSLGKISYQKDNYFKQYTEQTDSLTKLEKKTISEIEIINSQLQALKNSNKPESSIVKGDE